MTTRRCTAVLALLACVASTTAPALARHPWTQPGHLRIGVVRTLDSLNPLVSGQAGVTDLAQFLFSGLIRVDDRGELIPDAAEAVPTPQNGGISRDGRTITYRLRHDVKFADGKPLTADDVVFTYEQIRNKNNNVPYLFPYDQAESVVAKGPYTIVVRLKTPSAPFIASFFRDGIQGAILPKHLLAGKHDLNHDPFNTKPVGSGPYVVTSYDPNQAIEMRANPYYFRGKPGLERITYRIIPNENTLLTSLRTHEIDFYWAAAEQQYGELKKLEAVHISAAPFSQYEMLVFNARRAPLDDVAVRHAIARAIDWQGLAKNVYLGVGLAQWGDVFPKSWAFTDLPDPTPYDPNAARAALDRAGWKTGPDGIRQRKGKRLELTIRTVAGVIARQNAEVFIQSQLKAVGAAVEVSNAPANMVFAPYGAGGIFATGQFDLAIYAWTKAADPQDNETASPDRVPPNGANYSGTRDAELGRRQAAADREYDHAKRKPLIANVERRLGEVLPYHTIVWRANIDAWNDDVQNVKPGQVVSDFWNVADWRL